MDFFGMGPLEILVILIVAMIVFGPRRLPEIGASVGKAVREFRKATTEMTRDFVSEIEKERAAQPAQAPSQPASDAASPALAAGRPDNP